MNKRTFIYLILLFSLFANSAIGCRFTVCEIGFADFGTDNYRLVLFDDETVSENNASIFKKTAFAALLDANIQPEVIKVTNDTTGQETNFYNSFRKNGLPLALLISPEREALPFYPEAGDNRFRESVWQLLEEVTSSLNRIQVLEKIVQSYSVVLFVEGKDKAENKKALEEINSAIEEIEESQAKMPKPYEYPPQLITLKAEQIKDERVFLWSLGWQKSFNEKPVVAVLYGRGRMMGQLLAGNLLHKTYINNLLALVGADCECGLDRSWILGRMMPLRWTKERQKEVVNWRKFDAENPLIRAEMSKILSISPSKARKQGAAGTATLYGYTESEMKIVESYSEQQPTEKQEPSNEKEGFSSYMFYILASFLLLILIIGLYLFIKRK